MGTVTHSCVTYDVYSYLRTLVYTLLVDHVYARARARAHTYTCIYTHTHNAHTHKHKRTHMHTHTQTRTRAHTHPRTHTHQSSHTHTHQTLLSKTWYQPRVTSTAERRGGRRVEGPRREGFQCNGL